MRDDRERTYIWQSKFSGHDEYDWLTWSRNSTSVWASLTRKLPAMAIFDGQLSNNWTSERHSSEVIHKEQMFVQNRASKESVSRSDHLSTVGEGSSGWCSHVEGVMGRPTEITTRVSIHCFATIILLP